MSTLNIFDRDWQKHREKFTDDEKETLRKAVVGESICPKGVSIELAGLPDKLSEKLLNVFHR